MQYQTASLTDILIYDKELIKANNSKGLVEKE